MSVVLQSRGPLAGDGAVYKRRNVESQRDYDPLRQRQSYLRKESQQWARPIGPQRFQQYSQVVKESASDEPNQRRAHTANYQYLTEQSPNSRTKAVRTEQKFEQRRRDGHGSSVHYSSTSVQMHSTVTTAVTMDTKKEPKFGRLFSENGGAVSKSAGRNAATEDFSRLLSNQRQVDDLDLSLCLLTHDAAPPLDHSKQIDKKNLSGSLSRRRPTRSTRRRRFNMADISFPPPLQDFNHDFGLSSNGISASGKKLENGHGRSNDVMKDEPDLIRDVKHSSTTNGHHHFKRMEQEPPTAPLQPPPSSNWLTEAKSRLRNAEPPHRQSPTLIENGHTNGHTNGHSNGHTNGHSNGQSNGKRNNNNNNNAHRVQVNVKSSEPAHRKAPVLLDNGYTNGHTNGHSNGYTNGHSNGHSNGHRVQVSVEASEKPYQSLEKNKSKSTSNLDDDETIEAPWFRDRKYRKPPVENDRQFAKSSINLQWSSTEPLKVTIPFSNANTNNKSMVRIDPPKRKQVAPPPLLTTGVVPQRVISAKRVATTPPQRVTVAAAAEDVEVNWIHIYRNPVNDKVVIITKNEAAESGSGSRGVAAAEGRSPAATDRYAASRSACAKHCDYDDPDARLPKKELQRRTRIDWDNLDRRKQISDRGTDHSSDDRRSPWLKLKRITINATGSNDDLLTTSPSTSGRRSSSPGYTGSMFLSSEDEVTSLPFRLKAGREPEMESKRESFYASETWRKLEETLQQVNRKKKNGESVEEEEGPEWLKEARKKKNSWSNLSGNIESWVGAPPASNRLCVAVNVQQPQPQPGEGGTSWKYRDSASSPVTSSHYQHSNNSELLSSSAENVSEVTFNCSSSSGGEENGAAAANHNNNVNRIQVEHSDFDVDRYVRQRFTGVAPPQPPPPPSTPPPPDWLLERLTRRNQLIDWNSLEKLNYVNGERGLTENVRLRKVPLVARMMSEETRIMAALKPFHRRPQGSTSSDVSEEWADALEHQDGRREATDESGEEDEEEKPKDDDDVFPHDDDLKVKGQAGISKESGGGAPWITEIQLRSRSKPTSALKMPCIRQEQTTSSEVVLVEGEFGRKYRSTTKLEVQSSAKKVTFCIPNSNGDEPLKEGENRDDPEWIKMAEAKCKKTIKWDDLDKQPVIPKATNSTTTWITQVHLKHVPVSLEEGVRDAPPVETEEPKIKVNLRHVPQQQTEVTLRVGEDAERAEEESEEKGPREEPDWLKVARQKKRVEEAEEETEGAAGEKKKVGPREEPDWMKVARQKKQVRVDWEQLESSKKFGSERHLSSINEDNQQQQQNGYFSHHLFSDNHLTKSLSSSSSSPHTNGQAKSSTNTTTNNSTPYRTWVINKQKIKEPDAGDVGQHKWQSEPQLNTIPVATKPHWFQLAEKKRNSVADWSALNPGLSPMTTSANSACWMHEVRLRTPSPTPSPHPEPEDECTSPFPIQLRHVEGRSKAEVAPEEDEDEEEEAGRSPWISRSNSTETDKWQIRYRELFEDLSDEPSPTENPSSSASANPFDDYQALPVSSSNTYLPINSPQTRSTTSSPRKFRTFNFENNQQRRRLDFHHRYYSLPEMNALPLSANELQIVSLNKSESSLSVDERPPTIPESPSSEDNEVQEEKLIPFVRLRPTEKKEAVYDVSPSNEDLEPFWMKEIKLRKVPVKDSSEEMGSHKMSHSFSGDHLHNKGETEARSNGKAVNNSGSNRMPRAVSAPSHISTSGGLSIREAIHRDLKREVARREERKSNGHSRSNERDSDTGSESSFTSVSELSVLSSTTSSKTNSMETLIVKNTSEDKSIGSIHHKKPLWLDELKQKKSVLKPVDRSSSSHSTTNNNKTSSSHHHHSHVQNNNNNKNNILPPSFENVLEEIKRKGKDKLFSNLRPSHKRQKVEPTIRIKTDYSSSSSSSSLSSTPLSALSDEDEEQPQQHTLIISETDIPSTYFNQQQEPKSSKPLRPVSAPITVNHILQQHSNQLIDGNRFSPRKNGDSPTKEKLKSSEEGANININKNSNYSQDDDVTIEDDDAETEDDVSEKTFSATAEDAANKSNKQSLEDLKSPLLLLDLLSRISKSCSETNLTGLGAPSSAKSRFEAATSRMTSSCSNLQTSSSAFSSARRKDQPPYDDLSWSSGASILLAQTNNHELQPTVASSSSASDLEVYEEAESDTLFENCKSEFSLQLKQPDSSTSTPKRNPSEISLD